MADSVNNIVLKIPNEVDPGIAPRIIAIADAGDKADKSVRSLKEQLASLQGSGVATLLAQLNSLQGALSSTGNTQASVTARTQASASASSAAAASVDKQTAAEMRAQAAWQRSLTLSDRRLATAQALAEAKQRDAELDAFAATVADALTSQLSAQAEAQTALAAAQRDAATAAQMQAELNTQLEASQSALLSENEDLAAAYVQLAEATILAKNAKTNLAAVTQQAAIGNATEAQAATMLAAAMAQEASATEQLALAKNNLAEVQSYVAVQTEGVIAKTKEETAAQIQAMSVGTMRMRLEEEMGALFAEREATLAAFSAGMTDASLAAERQATAEAFLKGMVGASTQVLNENTVATNINTESKVANASSTNNMGRTYAAARIAGGALSGSTNMMVYGFARLGAESKILQGIMSTMFPVIIAGAMVQIVYQLVSGITKFVEKSLDASREIATAFDNVIVPLRKTNDELALTNDKLDATIAKLEHKPTTNGAEMALDNARVMADRLDDALQKVQNDLDSILKKDELGILGGMLTGQANTLGTSKFVTEQFNKISAARDAATEALDNAASHKDSKAAQAAVVQAYANERNAIQSVISSVEQEYNAKKKLQTDAAVRTVAGSSVDLFDVAKPHDYTAQLTMLGKAGHLAQQELRNLDLTMSNMQKNNAVDHLRDATSQVKANAKEAAEEWKKLMADFVKFQTNIVDTTGHKATAEQDLSFLVSKEPTINPLNRDKLSAKELTFRDQIAKQSFFPAEMQKLQDQVAEIGLYDDALKESSALARIREEAQRKNITLTDQQTEALKGLIAITVESRNYDEALQSMYRATHETADEYAASVQALQKLFSDGTISFNQYSQALAETKRGYDNASSAVAAFRYQLSLSQADEKNRLGTDSQIAAKTALEGLDSKLRQKGADSSHPFGYSESEIQAINRSLEPLIAEIQRKNAIDEQANAIIMRQSNLTEQLAIRQAALNKAVQAGAISRQAANAQMMQGAIAKNDEKLNSGVGGNPIKGGLMDYLKQFTTIAAGIKQTYSEVFKTIGDGAADAFGRAIAYGQNLGTAIKNVAKDAIGELISGLIKLGIQQVLMLTLGSVAASAATAAGVAQATALATAWAPAAFAASVATLGAADVTGGAAYASGLAAVMAVSSVPKLSTGTNALPSDMLIMAHQDERIIPAADNRELISTLKQGTGSAPSGRMNVEVHNYGPQRVEVQQMTDDRVRVIVRQEGPNIVAKHAPGVIAKDIEDGNGSTAKAIHRNVTTARLR